MNREAYRFKIQRYKSHLTVLVSEEGISITKVQACGFGQIGTFNDTDKARVIGRVASLEHILNLRIRGYTESADLAFKTYKEKHSKRISLYIDKQR